MYYDHSIMTLYLWYILYIILVSDNYIAINKEPTYNVYSITIKTRRNIGMYTSRKRTSRCVIGRMYYI